jgi:hypothetical protein
MFQALFNTPYEKHPEASLGFETNIPFLRDVSSFNGAEIERPARAGPTTFSHSLIGYICNHLAPVAEVEICDIVARLLPQWRLARRNSRNTANICHKGHCVLLVSYRLARRFPQTRRIMHG